MGRYDKNRHNQKRRNTAKGISKYPMLRRVAEQAQERDDAEDFDFINQVLRSTEQGYIKRKYNS